MASYHPPSQLRRPSWTRRRAPALFGRTVFTRRWARTRLNATRTRAVIQAGRTSTTARPNPPATAPARPRLTGWSSRSTACAAPGPTMRDAGWFTRPGSGLGRCETHHPHRLIELDGIPLHQLLGPIVRVLLQGLDDALALE